MVYEHKSFFKRWQSAFSIDSILVQTLANQLSALFKRWQSAVSIDSILAQTLANQTLANQLSAQPHSSDLTNQQSV